MHCAHGALDSDSTSTLAQGPDLRSPGTVENLRSNPSIEINVVDQLVRKGYRFKGTGTVHTDGEVFERGVQIYEARGTVKARERIRGIVIVSVERALPVTSPPTTSALQKMSWERRRVGC